MRQLFGHARKTVVLWLGMMLATIAAGLITRPMLHLGPSDGPITAATAMLLVNGLDALVIGLLAPRITEAGYRKALVLFAVVFMLDAGLSTIEATFFRRDLGLGALALVGIGVGGLIRASSTALLASLLWPKAAPDEPAVRPGLSVFAGLVAAYITLYLVAGYVIAWQSLAVRNYYHHGASFHVPSLLILQFIRGSLWVGLAYVLSSKLHGRTLSVALLTGAAFMVLMSLPLIYPSAIMPWAVRQVHLVELAASNLIFGVLAASCIRRCATERRPAPTY